MPPRRSTDTAGPPTKMSGMPGGHRTRPGDGQPRTDADAALLARFDGVMRLPIVVSAVLPLIVVPEPTTYPTALTGLSDVSVTEGSAIDGKALAWNNGASKWEAITVVTSIPTVTLLGLPDVDATGVADTYVMSYHAATSKVQFVAPSALASLPALSSVGDVTYGAGPGPRRRAGPGTARNGRRRPRP